MSSPTLLTAKPWTRWWWMGSAVSPLEITRHLEAYALAGIGGVEITPIYGARGAEQQFIPLLSTRWFEMLEHTIREGARIGIGVDMTLGSGWPYGGAHVTPDAAPRQAELVRCELPAGKSEHRFEGKRIEAAHVAPSSTTLAHTGPDMLSCIAPTGGGALYVLLSRPTGQQVKRAAPGGEGDVMCPYRRESFDQFIAPYTRFLSQSPLRPRAIFYDSFEVFAASFAPSLPSRIRQLKGYDIADYLPALLGEGDPTLVARIRHDYRDALADCLLNDGIAAWVQWCHRHNLTARYQAHGAPGNLIDLYAAADIPETEVFGTSRFPWLPIGEHPEVVVPQYPLVNKLASSAAHLTGKRLVSSETYTWLREHYCSTLAQMKAEADQLFFTGINHIFFHGSTYSPKDAPFPGWQFYASTHCDISDPLWHDLPQLNHYIEFCQSILQRSQIVTDLLFYFPFHDILSRPQDALFMQLSAHTLPHWIAEMPWGAAAMQLWQQSYAFDFISDLQLDRCAVDGGITTPAGRRYRAIVIPPIQFMPLATLRKLDELSRAGVTVIVVGELPVSEPGLAGFGDKPSFRELRDSLAPRAQKVPAAGALPAALSHLGIHPCPATPIEGLRAMQLRRNNEDLFFLANFSASTIDTWVDLRLNPGRTWTLVDPSNLHATGNAATHDGRAYIQLHPGQSAWLMPASDAGVPYRYLRPSAPPIDLHVAGQLEAIEGGPTLPPPTPISRCATWTELSPAWRDFSGTARYTLTFDYTGDTQRPCLLRFPAVGESLRVSINGGPFHSLWYGPYELEVTGQLRLGRNELVCEVTNLAANRIAATDRAGIPWRNFYEVNFVNLHYKPFDASNWSARPSGLLANPQLIPMGSFDPAP